MPIVPFTTLPDSARVWVFGAQSPLAPDAEQVLLDAVDAYLAHWKAHGSPLTVSRDWREHRFLTIAVDTSYEYASGCSIDGLFRELRGLERQLGVTFVSSGNVFYRDNANTIHAIDRTEWEAQAQRGDVNRQTRVFDMTVPSLGDWKTRFETEAEYSWHRALLPETVG
jgi:hypothetical protein